MITAIANVTVCQHPDTGLIDRLVRRDAEACETLVRMYSERLHSAAVGLLRHEEDATDAVQEAFLAALAAADSFRGQSSVYTWLYRILINVCLMKLRSRRAVSCDAQVESLSAPADDDPLIANETCSIVRRCIDRLPADYRRVLVLRDLDECDTHETARLLKMTPGAVKTRLHRARQALRALLEPALDDECLATGA